MKYKKKGKREQIEVQSNFAPKGFQVISRDPLAADTGMTEGSALGNKYPLKADFLPTGPLRAKVHCRIE